MVAHALPKVDGLKQTLGPGTSVWRTRKWWCLGDIAGAR